MEEHITPLKTGIKYGGYLGAATIVTQLISHYGGLQDFSDPMSTTNIVLSVLGYVISFILTFLGIKYYRSNNEGLLTFGEGVSVALFIGLFSGIIGAIFMYIYAAYLDPGIAEAMMSGMDLDEMSSSEAEAAEQAMGFATSPIFLAFSAFIGSIILGLILGVISSAILKKD